jgi:hypothetical protein
MSLERWSTAIASGFGCRLGLHADASSRRCCSSPSRRMEASGSSSASYSGVRALAIGATTAGRVRSQARATAATVVLRAAAIPSSAARIRSPLSSRYCAAVEARWLSTFAPGRYLPARKIGTRSVPGIPFDSLCRGHRVPGLAELMEGGGRRARASVHQPRPRLHLVAGRNQRLPLCAPNRRLRRSQDRSAGAGESRTNSSKR